MLESHLHAGRQDLGPDLAYGVSITDGCIDWDTSANTYDTQSCSSGRQGICECDGLPVVPGTY